VALRAILDRSCARRREHLCGRGEGKPTARVELEKWTWREKKSRLIDNFVLAFCVAIRERRNGLPRSNKETDNEIKCVGPRGHPLTKITPYKVFGGHSRCEQRSCLVEVSFGQGAGLVGAASLHWRPAHCQHATKIT